MQNQYYSQYREESEEKGKLFPYILNILFALTHKYL